MNKKIKKCIKLWLFNIPVFPVNPVKICLLLLIGLMGSAAAKTSKHEVAFRKIVVDQEFRAEGVAVADFNRDDKMDFCAGNFWYENPTWTPHEIEPPVKFNAAEGWSNSFQNFALDVNGDGWPDQIVFVFPGKEVIWRENPGRDSTSHWKEHVIYPNTGNESPVLGVVGGKPALIFGVDESQMAWFEVERGEFVRHLVSEANAPGTKKFSHGLGVGDVNGDGRPDVIVKEGYWEAPVDARQNATWKFVSANLGPDCAYMYAYDVNGDGLMDVISSSAHKIGVWWYEQKKGANGPEFVQHVIDETFSQSHSLVLTDLNGDGVPEIVTGKRFWAHGPKGDVQPGDPAMLYWFELRRGKDHQVEWVRHEIDNDSGVGTQFAVADLNGDKRPDIIIANKKGVFVFEQTGKR